MVFLQLLAYCLLVCGLQARKESTNRKFGKESSSRNVPGKIIGHSHDAAVVMFFAFSCLFTLSPQNMQVTPKPRRTFRCSLTWRTTSRRCQAVNPRSPRCWNTALSIIALVAIFKSFFGHYLGTPEGLNGLILKFGYKGDKKKVSVGKLNTISMVFIMGSTGLWPTPTRTSWTLLKPWVRQLSPLLCLLPMYAIRKAPALAKYKGRTENIFVTVVGLLTILNIVYKLF